MADGITITIQAQQFAQAMRRYIAATQREEGQVVRHITERLRVRIMAYSPVDTGRLRNSWRSAMIDPLKGKVSTDVPYAVDVEYGLYKGVGPRTIRVGPKSLGLGIQANAGVYSSQSPWGMVRRGLADEGQEMVRAVKEGIGKNWGK